MITIKQNSYDGIIIKPELDDALEHYGVKGMKWRKRKGKTKPKMMTEEQKKKYNARKMADDVISGKRKKLTKVDVDPSNGFYVSRNIYPKQKSYTILGGNGPADHRKGQKEVQAHNVKKTSKYNTELSTKYAYEKDYTSELKKRKTRKK